MAVHATVDARSAAIYEQHRQETLERTDRLFALLMVAQTAGALMLAGLLSPFTWAGDLQKLHPHVMAAVMIGPAIASAPIILAATHPGSALTRHGIAIAQMLMSALLIHVTGGRIETHFHVFGSLAFLAFYRDWKVLVSASLVVAIDHWARGVWYPQSVYGVTAISPYRWMEHTAWVAFEDFFLVWAIRGQTMAMRAVSHQRAELEISNEVLRTQMKHIRESEARSVAILEASMDCIITVTEDGQIVEFNPAAEKTFGYSRDGVIGRSMHDLLVPDSLRRSHTRGFEEFRSGRFGDRNGGDKPMSVVALRSDGAEFRADMAVAAISVPGAPTLLTAYLRDATGRLETEAMLKRAKIEAEAASQAKSAFVASMSHEIRTPMNAIIGLSEDSVWHNVTPEQRRNVQLLRTSAMALMTLVDGVLDFTKIEAGKLALDDSDFDLFEQVEMAVAPMIVRAHEKRLELICEIRPDVPRHASGDGIRFRQVVANLVTNAIKFTDTGEVHVTIGMARSCPGGPDPVLDAAAPDDVQHVLRDPMDEQPPADGVVGATVAAGKMLLHVAVRDTGPGIPLSKHRSIFAPFEQADASTARRFGGTGLGLSICSQIVDLMKGQIWLKSEISRGTTFHFTAVLGRSDRAELARQTVDLSSLRDVPVLLVEDNDSSRRVVSALLRRWSMRVTVADSALAAFAVLREQPQAPGALPFRVLITDLYLPEIDGLTLIEQLLAGVSRESVAVILLSGLERSDEATRAGALGVSAIVRKPMVELELQQELVRLLKGPAADAAIAAPAAAPASIVVAAAAPATSAPAALPTAPSAEPLPIAAAPASIVVSTVAPSAPALMPAATAAAIAAAAPAPVSAGDAIDGLASELFHVHRTPAPPRAAPKKTDVPVPFVLSHPDDGDFLLEVEKVRMLAQRRHILIVEDNEVNRILAVELLKRHGYETSEAPTAELALEKTAVEPFYAILMDVNMPRMDGLEATMAIRRQPLNDGTKVRRVPIVALTAHAMAEDRRRCIMAGMDEYLSKPFTARELTGSIERAVASCEKLDDFVFDDSIVNRDDLMSRMSDDQTLLERLVVTFRETCPSQMAELEDAIKSSDMNQVRRKAHTLRGALMLFSATASVEATVQLERATELQGEAVQIAFDNVVKEVARLGPYLEGFARAMRSLALRTAPTRA